MSDEIQRQTLETVTRMDERLANHVVRFEQHMEDEERRFARVEETIYGNGQPGLTARTALLESHDRRRGKLRASLWSAALAVVTGVLVYWLTR